MPIGDDPDDDEAIDEPKAVLFWDLDAHDAISRVIVGWRRASYSLSEARELDDLMESFPFRSRALATSNHGIVVNLDYDELFGYMLKVGFADRRALIECLRGFSGIIGCAWADCFLRGMGEEIDD